MRVSTNLTNTKTDNAMVALLAFYRAIGVAVPNSIALRPYDEKDSQFVDYLERSDVKNKIYIANTPVISSYGKSLDISPELNDGIGIEIADATQHYYRPSMKNVQSCHAECQMHRGGQLAYLQNPFWRQVTWYKPTKAGAVHPFRADYTDRVNYRGGYMTDSTEFIKVTPYVGKNLIATINIIPMFDHYGKLYFCFSRAYGDAFVQYGKLIERLLELYPGAGIALIAKSLGNWSAQVDDHHLPRVLKPFKDSFNFGAKQITLNSLPAIANFGHDKNNIYRYPDISRNGFLNVFNADKKVVTLVKEQLVCNVVIPSTFTVTGVSPVDMTLDSIATKLGLEIAKGVSTDTVKYISALTEYMVKLFRCVITDRNITETYAVTYILKTGEEVVYNRELTEDASNLMVYETAIGRLAFRTMRDLVLRVSLRNQLTPTITIGGEYSRSGNYLEDAVMNSIAQATTKNVLVSEVSFASRLSGTSKALIATKASGITHKCQPGNDVDALVYVAYNVKELLEDDNAKVILLVSELRNGKTVMRPAPSFGTSAVNWFFVKVHGYYFAYSTNYSLAEVSELLAAFNDDYLLSITLSDEQIGAYKMLQRLAKGGKLKDYSTATLQAVRKDNKLFKLTTVRKANVRIYRGGPNEGSFYNFAYCTPAPIETEQIVDAPTIEGIDDALLEAFAVPGNIGVGG